ncbi:MAG: hypothetical protein AN482_04200 [Anabaena sp. LE011-02]|jgi:hypothetical protein|nr:MAG: hypothetical protein AN482_04200 [Anabaena sp. LE011-02]
MKNTAIKAACIGLLASPLFLISEPASAGLNGQQLLIDTGYGKGKVTVQGPNGKGQLSTWTKELAGIAKTDNFYWKGTVTIQVVKSFTGHYPNGGTRTCTVNVPPSTKSNWLTVSCIPPR